MTYSTAQTSLLIGFFILSVSVTAQVEIQDELGYLAPTEESTTKLETYTDFASQMDALYNRHTKMATSQLFKYVSKKVIYPESQLDAGIEGTVFVEVVLNDSGEVVDSKIVKGLAPSFDEMVLRAMKRMKKIQLSGEDEYKGAMTITVPVHFSVN
ncbi:MAG: energy transducer TonB [Flavobacteriales bacterium]|nr:energy transducer TonB [Flavobacteriales bacterium]